jgi:large subunit ribosomal protein L18
MRKLSVKEQRKKRVRKKIKISADRPKLVVFRSNKFIYGQIIDPSLNKTLATASEKDIVKKKTDKSKKTLTKTQKAELVGIALATKATKKGIKKVSFDRGQYKYHGRVKALAEAARKNNLIF